MNSVEKAHRDILGALVIEHNIRSSNVPTLQELRTKYHLKISDALLESSIKPWEDRDILGIYRTLSSGTSVKIKQSCYSEALSEFLKLWGANEFSVDGKKEEVLADADAYEGFPLPSGWKFFVFEQKSKSTNSNVVKSPHLRSLDVPKATIDWTKWGAIAAIFAIPTMILLWWLTI
jgi:hypothetical protein